MYEVAKEFYFDEKALGNKTTRDLSPRRLLESTGIMGSASGVSSSHKKKSFPKTIVLSSDRNELCDRFRLLLQEEQAGNNSDILYEEIIAIADKRLYIS